MQTTSSQFTAYAQGQIQPLAWQLRASFDKTFDAGIGFFTLDSSLLDGSDVLAPSDNNVISEWDKFAYADYSDRVISLEITREELFPSSVVQSYADVTLNNYDDYFTPNSGSPIDAFILPRRPFRLLMGFGDETVPLFVGLSEKMPTIDKVSQTASFHLIDFLTYIFDKEVTESVMIQDVSTGEVLDYLFQLVGLDPSQYVIDPTSYNRIPFFYAEAGEKLGDVINSLMEAEQGRLYLDELGIIRFLSRHNYSSTPTYTFDKSNTVNYSVSDEDGIINSVRITGDVLREQVEQSIWQQAEAQHVPAGAYVDVWAELEDIATSITTPTYSTVEVASSYFTSTKDLDGTVPYTGITLSSISKFAKAAKMTFHNTGGFDGYVSAINLYGTPVKQVEQIIVRDSDATSIDNFEEQLYELETPYIQDRDAAVSKAALLIHDYKDYGRIIDYEVKGNPAIQIGDLHTLDLDGYTGDFVTTKVVNIMSEGSYRQQLKGREITRTGFFILDQSLLDGTDMLAP